MPEISRSSGERCNRRIIVCCCSAGNVYLCFWIGVISWRVSLLPAKSLNVISPFEVLFREQLWAFHQNVWLVRCFVQQRIVDPIWMEWCHGKKNLHCHCHCGCLCCHLFLVQALASRISSRKPPRPPHGRHNHPARLPCGCDFHIVGMGSRNNGRRSNGQGFRRRLFQEGRM